LSEVEQLLTGSRDDEITCIDITGRDGAGKWGAYPGKRLKFFQPPYLGTGILGARGLELEVCLFLGVFLFADACGL